MFNSEFSVCKSSAHFTGEPCELSIASLSGVSPGAAVGLPRDRGLDDSEGASFPDLALPAAALELRTCAGAAGTGGLPSLGFCGEGDKSKSEIEDSVSCGVVFFVMFCL